MFKGFKKKIISVGDADIFLRIKGNGPPVLLLHGYPQTHICWHQVAPILSHNFTVICPDLRGYGDSSIPISKHNSLSYSKRVMGQDMLAVMATLGFNNFYLVGHDRGARVAFRIAQDQPERVLKLVSLDVVPTIDTWEQIDRLRAIEAFHWSFLAQPSPFPENLIASNPSAFLDWLLQSWAAPDFQFNPEALNRYKLAFCRPETIHATCEDYRAGANIDVKHDKADRSMNRRIKCPILCLWGKRRSFVRFSSDLNPLKIWKLWGDNVQGNGIDCGHFLPEEAPQDTIRWLKSFFNKT